MAESRAHVQHSINWILWKGTGGHKIIISPDIIVSFWREICNTLIKQSRFWEILHYSHLSNTLRKLNGPIYYAKKITALLPLTHKTTTAELPLNKQHQKWVFHNDRYIEFALKVGQYMIWTGHVGMKKGKLRERKSLCSAKWKEKATIPQRTLFHLWFLATSGF